MRKKSFITALLVSVMPALVSAGNISSIDTKGNIVMKVRIAKRGNDNIIIGSDYNGVVLATDYKGQHHVENRCWPRKHEP